MKRFGCGFPLSADLVPLGAEVGDAALQNITYRHKSILAEADVCGRLSGATVKTLEDADARVALRSRKQEGPNQQTRRKRPETQRARRDDTAEMAQVVIVSLVASIRHCSLPCGAAGYCEKIEIPAGPSSTASAQ
jgi:hypothetical protein